jgi:hypothetical protein
MDNEPYPDWKEICDGEQDYPFYQVLDEEPNVSHVNRDTTNLWITAAVILILTAIVCL